MQAVISSAFESRVGLSYYSQLAVAVDQIQGDGLRSFHGLATSTWFERDVTDLELVPQSEGLYLPHCKHAPRPLKYV